MFPVGRRVLGGQRERLRSVNRQRKHFLYALVHWPLAPHEIETGADVPGSPSRIERILHVPIMFTTNGTMEGLLQPMLFETQSFGISVALQLPVWYSKQILCGQALTSFTTQALIFMGSKSQTQKVVPSGSGNTACHPFKPFPKFRVLFF